MSAIRDTASDAEILAVHPVMAALRPHVPESDFVARVRRQMESGYHLALLDDGDGPVAAAGYRFLENLAWGRVLYVDDLVTLPSVRSRGLGRRMLAWLVARARAAGCDQLHLDSGNQREGAHRFYEREGMTWTSKHFAIVL